MSKNIILKTIDEVDFFIKRIGREVSWKRKFTYFILTNEPLFEIDKLKTFLIENSLNDFSKNEISNLVSICKKMQTFDESYNKIPLAEQYDYFYNDAINGKEVSISGAYKAQYFVVSETKILPLFDELKFKELFQKDYDCFNFNYRDLKNICKNIIELLEPQLNEISKPDEVLLKNENPIIFNSDLGFTLFTKMHNLYKDEKKTVQANFSFLFHAMEKEFLICSQVAYIGFLEDYNIFIDKVDSRQSGSGNKKSKLYNSIKEQLQKRYN